MLARSSFVGAHGLALMVVVFADGVDGDTQPP
jgi:hypothetical protein